MRYALLFVLLLSAWLPATSAKPPGALLRVLVFLETECPISQKVTRRVQDLANAYAGQVTFETVYPTQTVTEKEVQAFQRTYALRLTPRLDPNHHLVNRYHATTTPEVILLSANDQILYQGAIDNQFYKLGKYRPAPTEFFLKDAIVASLQGRPVATKLVTPIGCLINRAD
ncbi:hypothetical protein [Fibrella aquatica]|uniref:hypothetical protein n=1 Tax=Fibrella aquatica TaxID=3242487 RepID=UPI0035227976